ncbi:hypothetical protein K1719_043601 [Acacia pycnantha]|nr:hypothetical protein K1719_043601 [Acacia pycnantha]
MATQNLCSKCYRDLQLKEQQSSSAKLVLNQSLAPPSSMTSQSSSSPEEIDGASSFQAFDPPRPADEVKSGSSAQPPAQLSQCMTCGRRVELIGFKCREQIAKANPVVKGEKLEKIEKW